MTAVARAEVCEVRIGKRDDLAYVVDSWIQNAPRLRQLRKSEATRRVRALLARPTSRLLVAHVPGEPDAILGWAAAEDGRPPCVHYIYVRSVARRQGVARKLVGDSERAAVDYSHPAPEGVAVPRTWNLNTERATT